MVSEEGNNLEYVITGEIHESKNCLVCVCGKSLDFAKENLYRMLNKPNESDKVLIGDMKNLKIEKVEDEDCWWNSNCD